MTIQPALTVWPSGWNPDSCCALVRALSTYAPTVSEAMLKVWRVSYGRADNLVGAPCSRQQPQRLTTVIAC
jgi:hypothetical protein